MMTEQFDPGENYKSQAVNMGDKPDNCLNHPKHILGESDMKVLAEMIENLHYESMAELFDHLSNFYWVRQIKDEQEGKKKLASKSRMIKYLMKAAYISANEAYQISKPFMEDKDDEWIKKLEQMPTIEEFNSKIKSVDEVKPSAGVKSKEEILKDKGIYAGFKSTYDYESILSAMEEYKSQSPEDEVKYEVKDRACPCLYLDEPCHPRCTCKIGGSSLGCMYCCTYGSLEQRKDAAIRIASKLKSSEPLEAGYGKIIKKL